MKKVLRFSAIALAATFALSACGGDTKELTTKTPSAKVEARNAVESYMPLLVAADERVCEVASDEFFDSYTSGAYKTCDAYIKSVKEGGFEQSEVTESKISEGEPVDAKTFEFVVSVATTDPTFVLEDFHVRVTGSNGKWLMTDFKWNSELAAEAGDGDAH